jgi:hypothetical protein
MALLIEPVNKKCIEQRLACGPPPGERVGLLFLKFNPSFSTAQKPHVYRPGTMDCLCADENHKNLPGLDRAFCRGSWCREGSSQCKEVRLHLRHHPVMVASGKTGPHEKQVAGLSSLGV